MNIVFVVYSLKWKIDYNGDTVGPSEIYFSINPKTV